MSDEKQSKHYHDLEPWMSDTLAESLSKKLRDWEVAALIATFRRLLTEAKRQAEETN